MDFLQFLASVIASAAWPLAVLLVLRMFKTEFSRLLASPRGARPPEPTVDFGPKIAEMEAAAAQATLRAADAEEQRPPAGSLPLDTRSLRRGLDEQIDDVTAVTPAAAVLLAWSELEAELHATIARLESPAQTGYISAVDAIYALQRRGEIDAHVADVAHRLRVLRAEVAHVPASRVGLSEAEARAYATLARRVTQTLAALEPPAAGVVAEIQG